MSDQTTPATEPEPTAHADTPNTGTETTQQQQEREMIELERYKQLQAEFTRTRQQMTDPEYQAQVAQEWLSANGYALPDDEPDPNQYEDPTDALQARIDQLESRLNGRDEQDQRAQQIQALEEFSERKMTDLGIPQDDPTRDWIVSRAIALPPDNDGNLNLQGAYEELQQLQTHMQKQWQQTKRAPRAPGSGQQATQTKNVDEMTPDELLQWQVQRLHDMET